MTYPYHTSRHILHPWLRQAFMCLFPLSHWVYIRNNPLKYAFITSIRVIFYILNCCIVVANFLNYVSANCHDFKSGQYQSHQKVLRMQDVFVDVTSRHYTGLLSLLALYITRTTVRKYNKKNIINAIGCWKVTIHR